MPAKMVSVNLLGHDEETESPMGRIINWATTYGRYIMVGTEMIVLLAFISRFSLDRKLTDLNESIEQKQMVIEANLPFERDIKMIQKKLESIETLIQLQEAPLEFLTLLKSILPQDVYIDSYSFTPNSMNIEATAASTVGFAVFINKIQQINKFIQIDVGEIHKDPLTGIAFQLSAKIAEKEPKVISNKPATEKDANIDIKEIK